MPSFQQAYQFNQSLKPIIEVIGAPLFSSMGINHFGYIKINKEGLMLRIANHERWNNIYFQEQFYNDPDLYNMANLPLNTKYRSTLSGIPIGKHCEMLYENNLWHFLLIYEKSEDEGHFFFFGTTKNNDQILNYYQKSPQIFDYYILQFKEKMAQFLSMERERCIQLKTNPLKNPLIKNSQDLLKLFNNYTPFSKNKFLSRAEIKCLFYIMEGYSLSDIAKTLKLPISTIKNYMANIKSKKGLLNRPLFPSEIFEID